MSLAQGRAFIDDLENNEGATFQLHALCLGKYLHKKVSFLPISTTYQIKNKRN